MLHFLCFDCIMCKRRGDLETASLAAAPAAPYAGALAARAQGAGFRLPMWGAAPPPALVARPWLRAFCGGPAASSGYGRNPKMILSQCCIDFDTKTYRFGHISGPSYRGAHAGWPAGWVVRRMPAMRLGHQHASKMRPLHQKVRRKCDPSCRNCVSGCLTASFGEHFGAPKIAPLSMK